VCHGGFGWPGNIVSFQAYSSLNHKSTTKIMDFLISNALAQSTGGAGPGSPLGSIIPLILIFVVFYFLLIRPQQKRAKEHKQMVSTLAKGDEVVTNGGLMGQVKKVADSFLELEVAEGTVLKIQRQAISAVLPKGTLATSK